VVVRWPTLTRTAARRRRDASAENKADCLVTVLDHFTTSFNWAAFNFAAIWLRPQWYLLTDSVITDVQQAGLTMVTGGGYSASDVITGHWALVRKSVFIGHTQGKRRGTADPHADNLCVERRTVQPHVTPQLRENAGGNRPETTACPWTRASPSR
jgi:hypothetical protein